MKPYGFFEVGDWAGAWHTDLPPAKPYRFQVPSNVEINRRAGRRRPKRVARAAARQEIKREVAAMAEDE